MTTRSEPLTALSADPAGETSGLGLPAGSLVTRTSDGPRHEPLLWVSDGAATPGTWARYRSALDAVGFRIVLLQDESGIEEWWDGGLDPGLVSDPGDHRAEDVLRGLWESAVADVEAHQDEEDAAEAIAPFTGRWPGLAPAGGVPADPDATAADVSDGLIGAWLESPRLALVPVGRAADLPAAIGWSGPVGHESDVSRLCAVLRSWEERFGARVVALSHARLDLSVAAPPRTPDEALAVAAEHFAFCPDNVLQGYDSLRLYAEQALPGNAHWTFWWD